jgi:hypothetical protein
MPGRRGRNWKRSPERNLGPSGSAVISRPAFAVADLLAEHNLGRPPGLPDCVIVQQVERPHRWFLGFLNLSQSGERPDR